MGCLVSPPLAGERALLTVYAWPVWPLAILTFGFGLLIGAIAARIMQRRHLQRIRDAERRARQAEKLAELGAMTAGLAHEIKNPLSTIGLNAQLLAEGISDCNADADTKPRLLNRIGALRRETDRLRGILQDFLDYAGQLRLERRPTDVSAVAAELVDFLIPEAERAGVRLRLEAPRPAVADVDVRLLKQALLNLLLNAIHAVGNQDKAAPKGEVVLRTARVQTPKQEPRIEIHVADTGPGITPENLKKVFDPYFTTKSGGTGLGLPTARRYIEEHGGALTVESAPGNGADFVITLPAVPQPASA